LVQRNETMETLLTGMDEIMAVISKKTGNVKEEILPLVTHVLKY